jgi:AraC-like DNA-binding protein
VHFSVGTLVPGARSVRPWVVMLDVAGRAGWARLHDEVADGGRAGAFALRHRCAGLLWLAWAELGDVAWASEGSPRLRAILEWMERRLGQPPGVAAMAAAAGLERRAFLRWFGRETGRTPADYLTERRIHEACRRLRFTAESIEQVAAATGFANRHHFSRVFRQRTGRTPANYRAC